MPFLHKFETILAKKFLFNLFFVHYSKLQKLREKYNVNVNIIFFFFG